MSHCAHIVVSGLVQGVFFRRFAHEKARKLGLKGWVKNMPSGNVEVMAEGSKQKIEKLIEDLEIGPSASNVEDIRVDWLDYKDAFQDFKIMN